MFGFVLTCNGFFFLYASPPKKKVLGAPPFFRFYTTAQLGPPPKIFWSYENFKIAPDSVIEAWNRS